MQKHPQSLAAPHRSNKVHFLQQLMCGNNSNYLFNYANKWFWWFLPGILHIFLSPSGPWVIKALIVDSFKSPSTVFSQNSHLCCFAFFVLSVWLAICFVCCLFGIHRIRWRRHALDVSSDFSKQVKWQKWLHLQPDQSRHDKYEHLYFLLKGYHLWKLLKVAHGLHSSILEKLPKKKDWANKTINKKDTTIHGSLFVDRKL